jgi:hypothetical protein
MSSHRSSRPSKFIEGAPHTHDQDKESNTHLSGILSEMDEFEAKRRHRGSQSSSDSSAFFAGYSSSGSSNGSASPSRHGDSNSSVGRSGSKRKGFSFGSRETRGDDSAKKFVGRLKTMAVGREDEREREREQVRRFLTEF